MNPHIITLPTGEAIAASAILAVRKADKETLFSRHRKRDHAGRPSHHRLRNLATVEHRCLHRHSRRARHARGVDHRAVEGGHQAAVKYIVTVNDEGEEDIFVFPERLNHRCVAEVLSAIRNQTHGDWKRIHRTPVSAGFVHGGVCEGKSESLNLESRPQDTALLREP